MRLTFLGTGTAFSPARENYHSNMVLESASGKRMLIDCGSDARHSLEDAQIDSHEIDAVYISHLHSDHCGGLEWLALTRKFMDKPVKPKLMMHPTMVDELWEHVLKGGLTTLKEEHCVLDTFFEIYQFDDPWRFHWQGIQFELIRTCHVYHMHLLRPSYGLFIDDQKTKIFITTDTQYNPDLFKSYYQAADYIFQDCETTPKRSGVHAHFEELSTLPEEIKNKMWLYHYSLPYLPKDINGFLGFVKRGQMFDFGD